MVVAGALMLAACGTASRPDSSSTSTSPSLHDLVCSGRMSLAAAQQAIASDWVAAFQAYG